MVKQFLGAGDFIKEMVNGAQDRFIKQKNLCLRGKVRICIKQWKTLSVGEAKQEQKPVLRGGDESGSSEPQKHNIEPYLAWKVSMERITGEIEMSQMSLQVLSLQNRAAIRRDQWTKSESFFLFSPLSEIQIHMQFTKHKAMA